MKKILISISCTCLLALSSAQADTAVNAEKNIGGDVKVDAKCHVVLVDGNESIALWRLSPMHYSKLTKTAVGEKTLSTKTHKEVKIYKVIECTLEHQMFTDLKSQKLDKKTLR